MLCDLRQCTFLTGGANSGRSMQRHIHGSVPVQSAHTLHGELFLKMPMIPLWQLDRHVVLSKAVQTPSFDPLLIFSDIEKWRLDKR